MNFFRKAQILFFAFLMSFTMYANDVSSVNTILVNARVYLEGALLYSAETGTTHNRPLMRDDLRKSPFDNQRHIPDADIYQTPYSNNSNISIDVTNSYQHVGCGAYPNYAQIPNPFGVFNVTGEDAIVDWVFVELRASTNSSVVVATRSGLLQRDGDIVDLDGVSPLEFVDVVTDNYYIAVRHRNHLGVMTKYPQTPEDMASLVDFSAYDLELFDFGTTDPMFDYNSMSSKGIVQYDLRAMWGGDFNADGKVIYVGSENDLTIIHEEISKFDPTQNPMYETNFSGAIGYLQGDYDMNSRTKFDNPDDDKNLLITQVFLYPLNTKLYANFAHFLQQLP